MGTVGMAFLPAAVTEPVVKPVTQSVELLTGDDKPETITVDFDEQPAALGISNYPHIQLGAMRYTTDSSLIDRASELLKGKTFKRWYGYASYRAKANDMVGGCHSSIELDTANGAKLCDVSYDPGYEGNEGPGIYIMDGDVAYVMEGDQTELNDFMGQCIQDAYEQTCLPDPQTARDSGSARTWLFEDEMPHRRIGKYGFGEGVETATTTKVPVLFVVVFGLSRSVTSWPLKVGLVLQI